MGREVKEPKHLLDAEEQNIGNSALVMPQAGLATTLPQTNPPRLIQLTGPSTRGQTTSVVVTAARPSSSQNPNPGYPGPITGVVEFGNGGRFTKVEFDVPVGPFVGNVLAALEASEPSDGGVIVSVPTGVLRVYTRYDNLLIAPLLNFNGLVALADVQGVVRVGPGGPVNFPAPIGTIPAEPVLTKAVAAYFTRHFARAYKTLYCYVGDVSGGGPPVAVRVSSDGPLGSEPAYYALPAFAQSLKILRMPLAGLDVFLHDGIKIVDQIAIAAGVTAPTIPLVGHEHIVLIRSTAVPPGDTVRMLALCCEVGV
jgi:hypothetical protein